MCWAAVWYDGRSDLVLLDLSKSKSSKKGFTAELYIDQILQPVLLPLWNDFKEGKRDPYIIEDGSPVHDAVLCDDAKADMRMTCHPGNSPDLNPIEQVWAELKRRMDLIGRLPSNKKELHAIASRVWHEIPQDFIRSIFDSMPGRCKAIVANAGGHIKG